MQEKTLFRLSLAAALAGLLFLFFYAGTVTLERAERFDSLLPEEKVTLRGILTKVSEQEKVVFLQLDGERRETIDVVLFREENIPLQKGDYVEITGTVEEYEGKKEVIAGKVELLGKKK